MKSYRLRISRRARLDIEDLTDFLLTVMSIEGARRYLDMMIAEVQSLSVYADLYRPSTMADIRQYHPKARRMMNANVCNSLILPLPTNCTGNRRESFLFVFNSFATLCRKVAAGWDGFVNSVI